MKLRLFFFSKEHVPTSNRRIATERCVYGQREWEGCLHAKNRTEKWKKTILVKRSERMRECIAAHGHYFEKVTNSLNADDEDDDSFYSKDK